MSSLTCPTWIDYLQALSAPAAVSVAVVAIWSIFKIERHRRRAADEERKLRARALELLIYPELLELKAKVIGSSSILKRSAKEIIKARRFDELSRLRLEVPPNLERVLDQMWLLGERAASPILQAVSVGSQFDRMVEKWIDDLTKGRKLEPGPEKQLQHLETHLRILGKLIHEAETAIEPLQTEPMNDGG